MYPRRALRAEDWRAAQMLSLLSDPAKIMNAAQIDTMAADVYRYLSFDQIAEFRESAAKAKIDVVAV